jgi:hypothetical protein
MRDSQGGRLAALAVLIAVAGGAVGFGSSQALANNSTYGNGSSEARISVRDSEPLKIAPAKVVPSKKPPATIKATPTKTTAKPALKEAKKSPMSAPLGNRRETPLCVPAISKSCPIRK